MSKSCTFYYVYHTKCIEAPTAVCYCIKFDVVYDSFLRSIDPGSFVASLLLNDVSRRRYSGSIGCRVGEVEENSPANPRWLGNWPIFGRAGGQNLSVAVLRLPERGFSPRLTVHVPRLAAATSFSAEHTIDMNSFSLLSSLYLSTPISFPCLQLDYAISNANSK